MSELTLAASAADHHLLLLPADVTSADFQALVYSTYPTALRQDEYTYVTAPDTSFSGPYRLNADLRATLGAPSWATQAWVAHTAHERADALPAELRGIDPLWDAHADGLLCGSEERAVKFLLAAARRLAGAVRTGGVMISADANRSAALSVFSPVWLDPTMLGGVVDEFVTNLGDSLTDADRYNLPEQTMSAYSMYGNAAGGLLSVDVDAEEFLPPAITAFSWAARGAVCYQLRYHPQDEASLDEAALQRAELVIEQLARAITQLAPGAVCDDDGFLVQLDNEAD